MGRGVCPPTDSSRRVWCFRKLRLDSEMADDDALLPRQDPGRGFGVLVSVSSTFLYPRFAIVGNKLECLLLPY